MDIGRILPTEAAAILNVSPQFVRVAMQQGKLPIRIECAKGEILNAMETIQKRHALPPCIMDGVLSSVLAEVRSEANEHKGVIV